MNKFKLLLLGGILSILSIGSFSNAQFISSSDYDCNSLNRKLISVSSFSSVVSSDSEGFFRVKYSTDPNCNDYNYCTWNDFGGSLTSLSVSSLPSNAKVLYFSNVSCSTSNGSVVYTISSKSDKMPVSVLSPVLDGLSGALLEFVPYVVYVGLGVLGALIGFFAIKRLINWVRRQSLGVFSSRKKK